MITRLLLGVALGGRFLAEALVAASPALGVAFLLDLGALDLGVAGLFLDLGCFGGTIGMSPPGASDDDEEEEEEEEDLAPDSEDEEEEEEEDDEADLDAEGDAEDMVLAPLCFVSSI